MKSRVLVVLLAGGLSGCWPARNKPVLPVVPPAPVPDATTQPSATPPDTTPATPPATETPAPTPPPTTPAPKPPVRQTPPPATPPQATATAATPAPKPLPTLGEILPDARRREIENDLTQNVAKARAAIARAAGRNLTSAQKETVERIRTFILQAEQSKGRDLSTALQLSRRAALLSDDLLKTLQ